MNTFQVSAIIDREEQTAVLMFGVATEGTEEDARRMARQVLDRAELECGCLAVVPILVAP